MKRSLMLLSTLGVFCFPLTKVGTENVTATEEESSQLSCVYDFTKIDDFSSWTNSYGKQRKVAFSDSNFPATIIFSSHTKQTSTITNMPVSKKGDLTYTLNSDKYTIISVSAQFKQWGTKAQTVELYDLSSGTAKKVSSSNNFALNGTISGSEFRISATNTSNQIGWQSLTVYFADKQTMPKTEKISISGVPTKKDYIEGDVFDPTGLMVTATYDDESTADITSKVTWSPSPLSVGDTSVTATYEEGGKNFTATYEGITVSKLVIEKIVISGNIKKTDYRLTDEWDITGIDASVTLGNSIEYTGSFDWNFSPKTPSDMGTIKNGELKVWANIGEVVSNELTFKVNVTNIISLNKTIKDIAAENNWSNSTKYSNVTFDENVIASVSGDSYSGRYYSSDCSWRLYQGEKTNSLTLTALNGYEFALVNIGTNSSISMSLNGNSAITNKDYQVYGTKIVVSATSTNLQITSIKLEYKGFDYVEKLNSWISSYLHFEDEDYQGVGTGLCLSNGTYKKAKEALLSLEESYPGIIEKFKENIDFEEAKARFENWAVACGDSNAYTETIKSNANALPSNLGDMSTKLILITFLMCLSLGTLSLFLVRRKHN